MSSSHFDIRGEISKGKWKKQISSPLNSSSAPETMGMQRTREADENVFPHESEPSVSDNPALFLPDTQYFRNIHLRRTRFQEYLETPTKFMVPFSPHKVKSGCYPTQNEMLRCFLGKVNVSKRKRHFVVKYFHTHHTHTPQIATWKKNTENNNN